MLTQRIRTSAPVNSPYPTFKQLLTLLFQTLLIIVSMLLFYVIPLHIFLLTLKQSYLNTQVQDTQSSDPSFQFHSNVSEPLHEEKKSEPPQENCQQPRSPEISCRSYCKNQVEKELMEAKDNFRFQSLMGITKLRNRANIYEGSLYLS